MLLEALQLELFVKVPVKDIVRGEPVPVYGSPTSATLLSLTGDSPVCVVEILFPDRFARLNKNSVTNTRERMLLFLILGTIGILILCYLPSPQWQIFPREIRLFEGYINPCRVDSLSQSTMLSIFRQKRCERRNQD